jgi:hypothetical protein
MPTGEADGITRQEGVMSPKGRSDDDDQYEGKDQKRSLRRERWQLERQEREIERRRRSRGRKLRRLDDDEPFDWRRELEEDDEELDDVWSDDKTDAEDHSGRSAETE